MALLLIFGLDRRGGFTPNTNRSFSLPSTSRTVSKIIANHKEYHGSLI
jgi:hypothetical protein